MIVEVVTTDELGDRSYVVHDGTVAVVIDPQRDVDRIEAVLAERHLTVALVLETHVHNDYVTGGAELARRTGARYGVNADDSMLSDRQPVTDGDALRAGTLTVGVVATPGHTTTHVAYVIADSEHPNDPPAVFTGGSLLFGSVGRTDLVDPKLTDTLTRAQYRSARRLAELLPDDTPIFPTHGFGSFCSVGSTVTATGSTIGEEKSRNDALVIDDEEGFVAALLANLTAYPAYYVHMSSLNLAGPTVPDFDRLDLLDPVELVRRLHAGEWVIDLRDRRAYAADHLAGTVSIALGAQFATYVGWLTPWEAPLTLIGETEDQIRDAQRRLVRIGIDEPTSAAGQLTDLAPDVTHRSYRRVDFVTAAAEMSPGDVLLDVRRDDEHRRGHLRHALHVPLHQLVGRTGEIPDALLWVHCASGYRASIAASILDAAGRRVVHIDDDYAHGVVAISEEPAW